jgi:hypothetical protein
VDLGHLGPRVDLLDPLVGRPGVVVDLDDLDRALPVGRAQAVGGGVAPADDHHPEAGRADR